MYRLIVFFAGLFVLSAQTEQEWMNRGIQAFQSAQYAEAVSAFEHAVEANAGSVTGRLYLATAHMQQYIPGSDAAENVAHADRAAAEFQRVLGINPGNKVALASLASLALNRKQWDQSRDLYRQLIVVDPNNPIPYYSIAFTIWAQWYPEYSKARTALGMRPEMPGPIADAAMREKLRAEWWDRIDDAMKNLNQALAIDPNYSDAMAYLNLFYRERADLLGTVTEYHDQVKIADDWVKKALEAKKQQAASHSASYAAPPPPPPPPPPPGGGTGANLRIAIGGNVQQSKLVRQVPPVYPPEAKDARIQGVVKLEAIVARDGTIANLTVLSGHPLLVPAAIEAVRQWQYQQTLLNGEPVEVRTQIDINFTLSQ
jgi:TonB family protein